jgi:L-ribulose-5-phosphate 3-epimerase
MRRRHFLAALSAAPLGAQTAPPAARPTLCIFSKHLAQLDWKQLGVRAKELGFDGVDLTVRPRGHVLPERVTEDLPKAVEAIREAGLTVPMITTDLTSLADPAARPTIDAMRRLGIPVFKPGYWRYSAEKSALQSIVEARLGFRGLLALARRSGVAIGLHNHSGAYVGAGFWEYREMLMEADPRFAGYYLDPAHATLEGGVNVWRVTLELATPRLKMVAAKDAHWERQNGRWRPRWVPLGEGMVDWKACFDQFARARFAGPLSLHVEYTQNNAFDAIARDAAFLRKTVAASYGG